MAKTDFEGAGLAALGLYKARIPGGSTTQQITLPNLKVTDAYADAVLGSTGNPVNRVCRLLIASGTGAVTVYEAVDSGHCDAAHTIWTQGTTVSGTPFTLDLPLVTTNGLFVTTAASTVVIVTVS